jgi:hypothetical protein
VNLIASVPLSLPTVSAVARVAKQAMTCSAGLAAAATTQLMAGIVQLKIGYVNNLKLYFYDAGAQQCAASTQRAQA